MPPSREAKDRGIRYGEYGRLAMFAALTARGISRLSAPTLFMKADRTATSPDRDATCTVRRLPMREYQPAMTSIAPEISSALLSTRTAPTVMTAGCPKPWKAAVAGTIRRKVRISSAPSATMS